MIWLNILGIFLHFKIAASHVTQYSEWIYREGGEMVMVVILRMLMNLFSVFLQCTTLNDWLFTISAPGQNERLNYVELNLVQFAAQKHVLESFTEIQRSILFLSGACAHGASQHLKAEFASFRWLMLFVWIDRTLHKIFLDQTCTNTRKLHRHLSGYRHFQLP